MQNCLTDFQNNLMKGPLELLSDRKFRS